MADSIRTTIQVDSKAKIANWLVNTLLSSIDGQLRGVCISSSFLTEYLTREKLDVLECYDFCFQSGWIVNIPHPDYFGQTREDGGILINPLIAITTKVLQDNSKFATSHLESNYRESEPLKPRPLELGARKRSQLQRRQIVGEGQKNYYGNEGASRASFKDGPFEPYGFSFGDKQFNLQPLRHKLVKALWDNPGSHHQKTLTIEDLAKEVYPDDFKKKKLSAEEASNAREMIKQLIHQTKKEFQKRGVHIEIVQKKGKYWIAKCCYIITEI